MTMLSRAGRRLSALLCVLAAASCVAEPITAQTLSYPPASAIDGTEQLPVFKDGGWKNATVAQIAGSGGASASQIAQISARASRGAVPECNGAAFPTSGSGAGTQNQASSRTTLWCPDGIGPNTRITLSGSYVNTTLGETDLAGPASINMTLAAVPAPWSPTRAYAVGDQVSWNPTFGNNNSPVFVAVAANTGSMPTPGNANWSAAPAPTLIPVTCGGKPTCQVGATQSMATGSAATTSGSTSATLTAATGAFAVGQSIQGNGIPAGATIAALSGTAATLSVAATATATVNVTAQGTISQLATETDPITPPGACATGACFVSLRAYQATASGYFGLSVPLPYSAGAVFALGTSVADTSSSGAYAAPVDFPGSAFRPALVSGSSAVNQARGTVCAFTDSIGAGAQDYGVGTYSIAAGGSGFLATDVGAIMTLGRAGATAGAVAADARFVITGVTSGAISSLRKIDAGDYTNVNNNTNQSLPTTSGQVLAGGSGTGATLNVAFATTNYEVGDAYWGTGPFARGLNAAGVRYTLFALAGDALLGTASYAQRDYSRVAMAGRSGCSSAIIELGINDVTNGQTAVAINAMTVTLAYQLKAAGVGKVYTSTIWPDPSSTDGYLTLAGQTAGPNDQVRKDINTFRRAAPSIATIPIDGVIDLAAAVEDGGATAPTGRYIVDGVTVGLISIGGKHPSPTGQPALAAPVTAWASTTLR